MRIFLPIVVVAFMSSPAWAQTHVMWHLVPSGGASPEFAARVERAVRAHFLEDRREALMDDLNMDSHLLVEGNEKFLRCGTGVGCLSGLGRAVRVGFVIAGEVGLEAERTTLRMVLVDAKKGAAASGASVVFEGSPSAEQLRELTVAMFEPERYRGSIELETSVVGAEVLLDGERVGVTPLVGPLSDLPAGEHRLLVRKPGHLPHEGRVRVPVGRSVRVAAELPALAFVEPPFYRDWPFWTAAGVGCVALVIAGLLHHDANILADNADSCALQELECEGDYRGQSDSRYLQAYLLYGVAGAGLLAAGLITVLDLLGSPGGESVRLAPMPAGMSPGAGLSVTWRF